MKRKEYIQYKRLIKKIIICKKKGDRCTICKDTFPYYLYEFHHTEPDKKEIEISTLLSNNASMEKIESELKKCILVCPQCHKSLHNEDVVPNEKVNKLSQLIEKELEDFKNNKGQIKYKKLIEKL